LTKETWRKYYSSCYSSKIIFHSYSKQIIKSKSEVAALKDFLDWLDQLKSKNPDSDGIVLFYHEERKFIPYMILQSLVKYGMLDRFNKTVKCFVNSFNLTKSSIGDTKHYSLRNLSKILNKSKEENAKDSKENVADSSANKHGKNGIQKERDEFDGNASVRAKLAYTVALQLSNLNGSHQPESVEALGNLFNALKPFTEPVSGDVKELDTQNLNLERQNSFRPVFLNYFKTTLYHRVRAVKFRIVLAENGFDLTTLNDIWTDKLAAGLDTALKGISNLKDEDRTELVELLDSFFDPEKATIKPVVKPNTVRRRNKRNGLTQKSASSASHSASDEFGAGGDKSQSLSSVPDSTTKTPSPNKSGGKSQRKRNSRPILKVKEVKSTETSLNNTASAGISVSSYVPIAATN